MGKIGRAAAAAGILSLCALGLGARYFSWSRAGAAPPITETIIRPSVVRAMGRLEPAGGIRNLAPPAPLRIEKILVKEGETVREGQHLAVLEGKEDREGEVALIDAQLREMADRLAAEQENEKVLLGEVDLEERRAKDIETREIPGQEETIRLLEKSLSVAKETLERLEKLEAGAIPKDQISRQRLVVEQSQRELHAARQALEKLKFNQKLALEQVSLSRRKATTGTWRARALLPQKSLAEQKRLADRRVERSYLSAPFRGQILKILVRGGEAASNRPVLQMGDTDHMTVVAEVYETDAPAVKPGQRAKVFLFKQTLEGTVTSVGLMIGKNSLFSTDPTARVDSRVAEITIALDQSEPAARWTNLQVDVEIDVHDEPR